MLTGASEQAHSVERESGALPELPVIVVLGPTAVGKTRLGVALAREFSGEIISADSRQVYRGMDIGTGKDLEEYGSGTDRVPAHLLDVVDPGTEYHLHAWLNAAREVLTALSARRTMPVIVGGSPLYINALIHDYELPGGGRDLALRRELQALSDQELNARLQVSVSQEVYAQTDTSQRARVLRALEIALGAESQAPPTRLPFKLKPLLLGIYLPRPEVHQRIEKRLDDRLGNGLIEEVAGLHEAGLSWQRLEDFGLEYRYAALFLQHKLEYREMRDRLLAKIRRFCRSQDIWYRKMEREGLLIHWLQEPDLLRQASGLVRLFLAEEPLPEVEFTLQNTVYGPRTGHRLRSA